MVSFIGLKHRKAGGEEIVSASNESSAPKLAAS